MIKALFARQIFDSRKNPTVLVRLTTEKGNFFASCPSGASTGKNEAVVLSADKAVRMVNEVIAPKIIGLNETDQRGIDVFLNQLDGTKSKKNLGANAILPVSIAVCRAGAKATNMPLFRYVSRLFGGKASLPKPCFNVINGGAHTDNDLDIQEFMLIPQEKSVKKNLKIAKKVFKRLKRIIKLELGKQSIILGDEGGFAPKIADPEQALRILMASFGKFKIKIGLDCAASQFYKNRKYTLNKKKLNSDQLLDYYVNLSEKYPFAFIEDPFNETDVNGFQSITKKLGKTLSIVGDDFLTTNIIRIRKAEENNACNGAIIKPNQIGTVTETIEAVRLAKSYGWEIIVSHRSGETMDDFIADLAVGVGADYIKSGAPSKPERLVKYKRLVKIEKEF